MVCSLFHIYGRGLNRRGRDWDRALSVVFLLYRTFFYFIFCCAFRFDVVEIYSNKINCVILIESGDFFPQSTKSTSSAILDKWIAPNIHFKDIFIYVQYIRLKNKQHKTKHIDKNKRTNHIYSRVVQVMNTIWPWQLICFQ